MATRRKRDIEKAYPRTAFAAKLRRFADSIERDQRFTIQIAGERIRVPAGAVFNIEHERSGDGEEIEFQIKWPLPRPGARKTSRSKPASRKTASRKTVSRKTVSRKTASRKTASRKTASRKTAPKARRASQVKRRTTPPRTPKA